VVEHVTTAELRVVVSLCIASTLSECQGR
jgi:hypothetical protein